MSFFVKNITNLNSIGVGMYPAVANLNMAGNSILNVNQINGQKFPPSAGISGETLHIGPLGVMYWATPGIGPSGPVGATGPAQAVGGLQGQITFNWDVTGDGIGESVGDAGLTYDWCGQTVNAYTLNLTKNLSVGSNVTVTGKISSGAATSNSIGNVTLDNGRISNAILTSNNIGAWTLTSSNFYSPSMTITTSGSITTPANISSSIAGVSMINSTISAFNSVIGGVTLSGGNVTASGLTINGTANITSATTISALLTVSSLWVQNALSVSGVSTYGGIATFLSNVGVGVSPSYTLDVQTTSAGSNGMRIAQNNATGVSAGLYLEAGFGTGSASTSNSTLVSFATRGGGGGTTVQSLMSIYEGSDYGLSIKAGNTVSSATVLRVTTNVTQRVGVGTVTPTTTLDVSGSGNFSSNVTIGGALNISGLATVSGLTVPNNISLNGILYGTTANLSALTNLRSINSIPVTFDSTNANILAGVSIQNLCGTNIVGIGSAAALNNSGSYVVAFGASAAVANTGSSVVAIGQSAGFNNSGGSSVVLIGSNAGNANLGSDVISLGKSAGISNSGSNVIAIGNFAGKDNTGSNMIYLGNQVAGAYNGTTGNNALIVYASSTTTTPFLYGDLSGMQLGIGKTPSAAIDVAGSGIFSGRVSASSAGIGLGGLNVSGTSTLNGGATVSGTLGVGTISATFGVIGTLSATTLNVSATITVTTLNVCGLATISGANITNTLGVQTISAVNATITTLSATTLNVSGTLTAATLNVCGLATISGASVTNTLGAQTISAANGIITSLSTTTFSVSGLSTLFNVSVQTISAGSLFAPNAVITTLSSTNVSVSGTLTVTTLNVCGLATISSASITNTLGAQTISAANGIITSLSTTTFSVSGLSTLFNLSVQTISAASFFATDARITTLSATTVNISGSLIVTGTTVFPNISGLVTINSVPTLLVNLSKYICFGISAGVRGTNVNAYGFDAGFGNTGDNINAIGSNAAQNNSGGSLNAFGTGAGASNTGASLIAIGTDAGASNIGQGVIAIGAGACTTNSGANVIGIGSNALYKQAGSNVIGIGVNAGFSNTASGSIFIGSNAGSNARFPNALVLGNNPSGGYTISAANTFLVYSTLSSRPFLQGDMSAGFFGIGKTPSAALDVVGSGIFSSNLTVSAGTTTLSLAIITTLSATNATIGTLTATTITTSAATVQGTLSASNIYVNGTGGQGITIANNGTFTMAGTFSNKSGSSTWLDGADLGATNIRSSLNGVTWPSAAGTNGQILQLQAGATAAWTTPAAVSLAGWAQNRAVQNVDMSSFGITNLSSINSVPISFGTPTANDLIGFGYGTLSGATGDEIFAVGRNAGIGAGGTNLIYLGSNPGGATPVQSNFFNMYSTTSGMPFLQGDLSAMWLGIGKLPTVALDVSGSATITGPAFNVCAGLATLSGVRVVNTLNVCGQANFSSNVSFTSLSASNVFVYTGGTLNVSGSTSLTDLRATTISGSSLYLSNTLNVSGLVTVSALTVQNSLSVGGLTTVGSLQASTISGSSLYLTGGLRADGITTLNGNVNITSTTNTLNVSGQTILGNLQATTISASNVFVSNSLNISGLATVSGLTVQRNLSVGGSTTLSGTTINNLLTVCGQTAFTNLCFAQLNGISWANPITDKTILTWSQTGNTVKWDTIAYLGLGDWAKSVAVSTISANQNGITGIVSFNNISAIFSESPFQIGIGPNVLRANTQSNIIALGISAGAIGGNTTGVGPNCIFLGSNPGGSSNVSNSLVVYSQTAASPLIYGDLSKNQVTIAGQTNTGGYTLNVNGSAQASMFTSPAASSNSIGGVTMSNSILTVGTINSLSNLNGVETKFDSAGQVIFIGSRFGTCNLPAGTVNVFLGQFAGAEYVGTGSVGIGNGAGAFCVGSNNTWIGGNAGNSSSGSSNNYVGLQAGQQCTGSSVNAFGNSAALCNQASYVDAIGSGAANGNTATGSNLIAIGSNAGVSNYGASNIYIGAGAGNGLSPEYNSSSSNAIVIGSLAGIYTNGAADIGNRSINIGKGSVTAQGSADQIAIGTGAYGSSTGSIAIGAGAMADGGLRMLVIGSNVSGGTGAADVIAIGTNAGSNLPSLSNNIYIGSNAGYRPTTANTLVVQSLVSTAPTLQADLSNRWLGVGKVPTTALDVQGSVLLTGGTVTLSTTTVTTNLTVCGTTTLCGQVTIANLTPTNITVPVGGKLSVSGATTLSGVTLNVLNGVTWPTTAGAVNNQLVISATGQAAWQEPGTIDSAKWSSNPALQAVNISGFDIKGIVSFNTISAIISATQIGIGPNVLRNNTAASVVAFGSNAGSNTTADSTFNNCVYLGSNPGTSAAAANTFLVYSTTANTPAIQVNMDSRQLGIGKVPGMALDVSGSAQIGGTVTTTGRLFIGGNSASSYSMNIVSSGQRTGFITWSSNTNLNPYIGIGWDQTADGLVISSGPSTNDIGTVNSFFVSRNTGFVGIGKMSASFPLDVSGQINTNTAVSTPSLAVSTSTVLTGTLTLPTIASTTYANRVLSYNSTTGAVTQSTLNLGTLGAADSNTMNANWVTSGGGLITWNGGTRIVSGTDRILILPVNNALSTNGHIIIPAPWSITMAGWSAAYWVPSTIPTSSDGSGSFKVISDIDIANQVTSNWIFICCTQTDASPTLLKWGPGFITIPDGGVYNSRTGGTSWNVLGQATNIALGSNSSITGGTSIVIGSNATSGVAANNVIAIGTNAGSNLPNLNNTIYIGSNAGYNPTTSNTLVVQSTSSTAPTLQADLSNRWLGVGMVPSNALDVTGTIRASGPVISALIVSGTSAPSLALTADTATTYFSLTSTTTAFSLTFPSTVPPKGTYWVLKNNSTVNYTITCTNGVFNGGTTTTYFLQAGIGVTLAYSGTASAYYTF